MTILTDFAEVQKIRESGKIIKKVFSWLAGNIKEGVSTLFLDNRIEEIILENGGKPAFKGYKGYPATICASVNEEVVHGIPSGNKILKNGDIVSIDVGAVKNGYYTDAARTYSVGRISDEARRLVSVTERCLKEGMKMAVAGNRVSDISHAIEQAVKKAGFKEVRAFVGHGIGLKLHEPPEVPNWGAGSKGMVLAEGLVLAIEPMVNAGTRDVKILEDGWTAVTEDGRLSAHFEDTIIVGKTKAEALT